ncbi:hypothetical protein [Lewinella sp. LCG006]|uniref:hypothetical protein n=1 Tax=Lewinella sp. LCG006 TaxID=3231911 RepID=UPI003460724D
MPTLNDLNNVRLRGRLIGAYDPEYWVEGLTNPVPQSELLTYILDNLGGGSTGGENDVTEAAGDPTGAPGAGEPAIYQNTTTGAIFVWDGSQWNEVAGSGDDDITEGTGVPSGAPGAGEPQVYQNTVNGNLYVWNGTNWVLLGGGENDITEGAGTPSGAPGAGEPQVYQDTTNGNVYTWDGTQWNIMAVVASNGLTKTGADIELGGTLEKNTTINTEAFQFLMSGNVPQGGSFLQTLFRLRPALAGIDLFTRDDANSKESSIGLLPDSVIIEVDGVNKGSVEASQLSMTQITWQAIVSLAGNIENRLYMDIAKVEVLAKRLEFKMDSAQGGAVGHVLTLVDVVSGRAEWQPATGGGTLPVYDSIADALAAGLSSGDRFKLSQNNTEGGVAGTVIELL